MQKLCQQYTQLKTATFYVLTQFPAFTLFSTLKKSLYDKCRINVSMITKYLDEHEWAGFHNVHLCASMWNLHLLIKHVISFHFQIIKILALKVYQMSWSLSLFPPSPSSNHLPLCASENLGVRVFGPNSISNDCTKVGSRSLHQGTTMVLMVRNILICSFDISFRFMKNICLDIVVGV